MSQCRKNARGGGKLGSQFSKKSNYWPQRPTYAVSHNRTFAGMLLIDVPPPIVSPSRDWISKQAHLM
jgi:hypothetical protein